MNHKIAAGLIAVAASALLAGSAHAQIPNLTPFSFEVRGGGSFPQSDFGDVAENGLGLSGSVTFHALPMVGVYAGYARHSFGFSDELLEEIRQETGIAVDDASIILSGPRAGVRLSIPTPLIPIDPFVEAGAFYAKPSFEVDGVDGEDDDADSELGFEASAGVGFNILPKVQLTPAVGYTRISFEDDDAANFFTASIGLRIRL